MITIRSSAAMARALDSPLNITLKELLTKRRDQLLEYDGFDLGELAHFIVAQAGDQIEAVEAEAGIPIVTNIVDGCRFGDPDYCPSWEWIDDHGAYWEAPYVLSDSGFGIVLFVENSVGTDPILLALCRAYATNEPANMSLK